MNAYMISIGKEDGGSKGLLQGGLSSSPPESPRVCSPANPGVLAAGCAKQDEEKRPHTMATTEKKRTPNTRQSTETQPALLAPDAFAAALAGIPSEDWSRTWAADRTTALRRTSKKVNEVVDKMRLPAVVCLSRSFWDGTHNGTVEAKQQFVLRQLAAMTERCLITTLALQACAVGENVSHLQEFCKSAHCWLTSISASIWFDVIF